MTDVDYLRNLARLDWLVSRSWNRLHHADLTDDQLTELEDETTIAGPIRLTCGRTAKSVSIPGIFSRMAAPRCIRCCRARGLPTGKGSPKNDRECRALMGLEAE